MQTQTLAHTDKCVYIYIYMCVVCVYIYKNQHTPTGAQSNTNERTDRQTGRQAGRQAGRQDGPTDRQTGRQAGRQADRHTGRQAGRQTDRDRQRQTETDSRQRQTDRQTDRHTQPQCQTRKHRLDDTDSQFKVAKASAFIRQVMKDKLGVGLVLGGGSSADSTLDPSMSAQWQAMSTLTLPPAWTRNWPCSPRL